MATLVCVTIIDCISLHQISIVVGKWLWIVQLIKQH